MLTVRAIVPSLGLPIVVADFVRQRPPFGNRKGESMRPAKVVDAAQQLTEQLKSPEVPSALVARTITSTARRSAGE